MQKVIVDTNILLDGLKVSDYEHVVIPYVVIEELDKLKRDKDFDLAYRAKESIKNLECADNIEIRWNNKSILPNESNDNIIISCAKDVINSREDYIFLSNDYNVRLKAKHLGIPCKGIDIATKYDIFKGIKYIEIQDSDQCIEDIINKIDLNELIENQYVCIGIWDDNNKYHQKQFKLEKAFRFTNGYLENVKNPRLGEKLNDLFRDDAEQKLIYDAVNCDDIDIIVVYGSAGTGKDFATLAMCLNNVNQPTKNKKGNYKNKSILYTRSTIEAGNKQGFLPGDELEKSSPYFLPARQNLNKILEFLGLPDTYETLTNNHKYNEQSIAFMRGGTFDNAYMILDESANSTLDEVKMFISRAGEDSKVIILGSLNQKDNRLVNDYNNGLIKVINAYKGQKNAAIIKLNNQHRSLLALQADELLK